MTVTLSFSTPDTILYANDNPFCTLDQAAAQFHISTGRIRELITALPPDVLARKVVRLFEERYLAEHWLVSVADLEMGLRSEFL